MLVNETLEYCRLRCEGIGRFIKDMREAICWHTAYQEIKDLVDKGYKNWPLSAVPVIRMLLRQIKLAEQAGDHQAAAFWQGRLEQLLSNKQCPECKENT